MSETVLNTNEEQKEKEGAAIIPISTSETADGEVKVSVEDEEPKPQEGDTSEETTSEGNEKEEETKEPPLNPKDDDMDLDFLDKDFAYDIMAVPTRSTMEWRMVVYIMLFARRNNIEYDFDEEGNIYLTKGKLENGEFYPCVTSHMDTVQRNHEPYILTGVPLDLVTTREANGNHKVGVDGIGVGADDKGGICICLSMFSHFDKLKACFFLNEESGCIGSKSLDKDWFEDVGFVIGYDSPELNRAAWRTGSIKLFDYNFYEKHIKEICDKWDLTRFEDEPITDVMNIRKYTDIICMNFGNGGYKPHDQTSEYFIMEEMDHALGMGIDLIKHLGNNRYTLPYKQSSAYKNSDGIYVQSTEEQDNAKLRTLGKNNYNYGGYNSNYYGGSGYHSGGTAGGGSTSYTSVKKEDEINFDTVKYIVERYDDHINAIKKGLSESIKDACEKNGISFDIFKDIIDKNFNNELKF